MSIDFNGVFEARAPGVDAQWLRSHLVQNPPVLAKVVERYRALWSVQSWVCEVDPKTKEERLLGPGGFSFRFNGKMIRVYHVIKFGHFITDPVRRMELRRVWKLVATLLEHPRMVYSHELMPLEGAALHQVEQKLREDIGPPAASFEEMERAEDFGPRAWYIDDFSDVCD